jgi:hypothetical protein
VNVHHTPGNSEAAVLHPCHHGLPWMHTEQSPPRVAPVSTLILSLRSNPLQEIPTSDTLWPRLARVDRSTVVWEDSNTPNKPRDIPGLMIHITQLPDNPLFRMSVSAGPAQVDWRIRRSLPGSTVPGQDLLLSRARLITTQSLRSTPLLPHLLHLLRLHH